MSIGTVLIAGLAVYLNAAACIGFFSQDPGVIQAGVTMIRIMCPFYLFLSLHQNYSGALRASGRSAVPMVTSVMAFVIIRQIYLAAVMWMVEYQILADGQPVSTRRIVWELSGVKDDSAA